MRREKEEQLTVRRCLPGRAEQRAEEWDAHEDWDSAARFLCLMVDQATDHRRLAIAHEKERLRLTSTDHRRPELCLVRGAAHLLRQLNIHVPVGIHGGHDGERCSNIAILYDLVAYTRLGWQRTKDLHERPLAADEDAR